MTTESDDPTPARPSAVLRAHRDLVREIVRRHHGIDVHVFGSIVKGDDIVGSDIDLLVTLDGSASLFDLVKMEDEIREAHGIPVDIVERGSVRNPEIFESAVPL
ncbi:nucleotidyltransferase family protein [Lysobacter korlensis]|uniref:Nucleotidyltransferase family protein n=1 Tax=Lysobacter korlensis TaxID=553636 RepID=A0ABV6RMS3_9GAMM